MNAPDEPMIVSHKDLLDDAPLASSTHVDLLGAYFPEYVAVRVDVPFDEIYHPELVVRSRREVANLHNQASIAIRSFTLFHEVRHFHDFFASLAGISLFGQTIEKVIEFCRVIADLKARSVPVQLPWSDWARRADSPQSLRNFVHRYSVAKAAERVFYGRVNLPTEVGFTDLTHKYVLVPELNLRFPAFPLRSIAQGAGADDPASQLTVWKPIGFEALIEGGAQALQRTFLESLWGSDVADEAWKVMSTIAATRQYLSAAALPYNITDLFMSKGRFLRGDRSGWERSHLLAATDYAISGAILRHSAAEAPSPVVGQKATRVAIEMIHPGTRFVETVEGSGWHAGDQSRIDALESYPHDLLRLADSAAKGTPSIRDLQDQPPEAQSMLEFSAYVVESYVLHSVIRPLLAARIAHKDRLFRDVSTYIEHFANLPQPIITQFRDRVSSQAPDFVVHHWSIYCMLLSIVNQTLAGASVFSCPRANSQIPGFDGFQFSMPTKCNDHIRSRSCLYWSPGRLNAMPRCTFTNMLAYLGFDRRADAQAS